MGTSPTAKQTPSNGLTLRHAALIAGFSYLVSPVGYAESIYRKLVITSNIEQTVHNIALHQGHFAVAILCYLIEFTKDVVIAWALYYLLAPVNRAMSMLTAWFRLMYTAMALYAVMDLAMVHRVVTTPEYLTRVLMLEISAKGVEWWRPSPADKSNERGNVSLQ